MKFKKSQGRILLRLERGEEIVEQITNFLQAEDIRAGSIVCLGAASHVKLRYYSMKDKQYHGGEFEGEFEIASLNGNISTMDSKIWPHIHIVLADTEYQCFGGHLESAIVGVTCEIVIDPIGEEVSREFDEETGLKLWNL